MYIYTYNVLWPVGCDNNERNLFIPVEIQAAGVQDAEAGREDAEGAALEGELASVPRARDARANRQDHQGLRQGARPQLPLPGDGR